MTKLIGYRKLKSFYLMSNGVTGIKLSSFSVWHAQKAYEISPDSEIAHLRLHGLNWCNGGSIEDDWVYRIWFDLDTMPYDLATHRGCMKVALYEKDASGMILDYLGKAQVSVYSRPRSGHYQNTVCPFSVIDYQLRLKLLKSMEVRI